MTSRQVETGNAPQHHLAANARRVLSLVRRAGSLSKAEIARASGLSAQSATVIVNRLAEQGLLDAGTRARGKIGQPSTPYMINPRGAFSLGVKLGRRSAEVVLMGLDFEIIAEHVIRYEFPDYARLESEIPEVARGLLGGLSQCEVARLIGLGLARPDGLSSWEDALGAPRGAMAAWQEADLGSALSCAMGLPVTQMNDASAGCLAALKTTEVKGADHFLYLYVGTFVGGGLALGGRVYEGAAGNALAIGSLPVRVAGDKPPVQLIEAASLLTLEALSKDKDIAPEVFVKEAPLGATADAVFEEWLKSAAPSLAFAIVAGQAFLDVGKVVLDTSVAAHLRARLASAVVEALPRYDLRGLRDIEFTTGSLGPRARALGAALLPFQSAFEPDPPRDANF